MSSLEHYGVEAITYKRAIEPHSFDADARRACLLRKQGRPVPSKHYRVGQLIIPAHLMQQAAEEANSLESRVSVGVHPSGEEHWDNIDEASPFLRVFLPACAARLRDFVNHDTGDTASYFPVIASAKPYKLETDNVWHRDGDDHTHRRHYFVTPHGPGMLFTAGSYSDSQFKHEMLLPGQSIGSITESPNNIITLHDESSTVHSAPLAIHNGEGRITVDCTFSPGPA